MTDRKLKILQIMECTIGGTRRHLRELTIGLAGRGHEVTAICSAERDPTFRNDMVQMAEAGVCVVELPLMRAISPAVDLRHLLFLRRFLKEHSFDLVHTHSSKAGALGRLAALTSGSTPLVHTPHTFAFAFKGHFSFWKRALFMEVERFLSRRTGRIVNVSQSEKREGLRYGILRRERAVVVENGIDPASFEEAAAPDPERALFPGADFSPRLGTVGLLNEAKGHDLLLDAFADLSKRFPRAGLVICGEGAMRPQLEARIDRLGLEGRAVLAGYRNDIPAVLKSLDLFVFPSLWEGMPYVVLEAMASGLPVVATDVNGSRDLVDDGLTGRLVPPGDVLALSKACVELLESPEQAARMALAGLERVRTRYTLERMLDRMESVYFDLLDADDREASWGGTP